MPNVKVYGAARLRRTLRQAGVTATELKEPNRAAAEIAGRHAVAGAPKVTGRLAKTIRTSGTVRSGFIRAGRKSVPYAGVIHWGWPARNIKANPWITRAAQESEDQWVDVYMRHTEELLDKVRGI